MEPHRKILYFYSNKKIQNSKKKLFEENFKKWVNYVIIFFS